MTRFVTATAALVLSPTDVPGDPARQPDVFDAFARVVLGLERSELAWRSDDGPLRVRHPGDPDHVFRATPLLRDGRTAIPGVPRAYEGRITPEVVARYMATPWAVYPREAPGAAGEPGWGMRIPITTIEAERRMTWSVIPATSPLVDPVRELTEAEEAEGTFPVSTGVTGEWASFFTPWENLDGLLGLKTPGEAWLRRRMARTVTPFRGFWAIIQGWHEACDGERYRGEWEVPLAVTVYLGWPAYLISAAGRTGSCQACGRVAIEGRRFCASPDCRRARAAERKRRSRSRGRARGGSSGGRSRLDAPVLDP